MQPISSPPALTTPAAAPRAGATIDQKAIGVLADSLGLPPEVVQETYSRELRRLSVNARVKDYLGVLAVRGVREQLSRQGTPRPQI